MGRVVVVRRRRLDGVEAGSRDRGQRCLRGAGHHHVGGAVAEQPQPVSHRVEAGGTAGRDQCDRAFGAAGVRHLDRDGRGHHVVVGVRYHVRRVDQPVPASVAEHDVLLLQPHRGADGAADADADPFRRHESGRPAVLDRVARAHERELRRPVQPPDLLRGQPRQFRIEVTLRGDAGPEPARVEQADRARRRAAGGQQVPEGFDAGPTRCHHPHPGDGDRGPGGRTGTHEGPPTSSGGCAGAGSGSVST